MIPRFAINYTAFVGFDAGNDIFYRPNNVTRQTLKQAAMDIDFQDITLQQSCPWVQFHLNSNPSQSENFGPMTQPNPQPNGTPYNQQQTIGTFTETL